LFDRLGLRDGALEKTGVLLVTAAAGGVGAMVTQLAGALTSVTVVGTASRPETVQFARRMGAHHVIEHRLPLGVHVHPLDVPDPRPGHAAPHPHPGRPARRRGILTSTATQDLGPVNAANLRRAHRVLESGTAIGKTTLTGFQSSWCSPADHFQAEQRVGCQQLQLSERLRAQLVHVIDHQPDPVGQRRQVRQRRSARTATAARCRPPSGCPVDRPAAGGITPSM
jgi:hypothetical protein